MIIERIGDPAVVFASFGRETLQRALGYLDAVDDVEVGSLTRSRITARATVQGSARRPYVVHLDAFDDGHGSEEVMIETWCSCPVAYQCKHGAALALDLGQVSGGSRAAEPAPPPNWRHQLDGLLRGLSSLAPPEAELPGLALRLTLDDPASSSRSHPYAGSRPTIRVRPMRPGKRGWVQSGVDWHELTAATAARRYEPRHLAALTRLQHSLGSQYWYHGVERSLADFDAQVLPLLREAQRNGVTVFAQAPLTDLRLLEETATTIADVVRVEDRVDLTMGIEIGGRAVPPGEVILLGAPVHSVAHVHDGVLSLAAMDTPLPVTLSDTLTRHPVVQVPAGQSDDLADYLRRIRRLVPVTSSDHSVDVPDRVRPRARVRVTWRSAAAAEVVWSWVYGEAESSPEVPMDSEGGPTGLRDRAAERAARAVLLDLGGLDDLDTTTRAVDGADTVSLALLELPQWRTLAGLEVVEIDPPDFREARDEPEIGFDLVEPEQVGSDHEDWLDLEVMITVDGERIPLPDVVEALTLQQDWIVLPSGLYVSTDQPALAKLAATVRAAAELAERTSEDRIRVGRHDLGVLADLGDVGALTGEAAEWAERAQALRDLVDLPTPEPVGLVTSLRGYQDDGLRWLAFLWEHRLGGILADDMGLGKTLQVLALVAHTRAQGHRAPFLVVAPTSVVSAWAEQAALHTPGLRVAAIGATRKRRDHDVTTLAREADLVLTSYTLLRLDEAEYAAVDWDAVVLDEAQQVKNHRSQAHQAIRRLRAPFKLAVTGTPFENRLLELWSLLSIVCPGLYPTQSGFNEHVARPVEKHQDDDALRRFTRRLKPFVLRRTKELVASDLPAKQEQILEVDLHPRHRKLYDSHLTKERQRILGLLEEFDENRVAILAALTRLRQLSLDPGLIDPAHLGLGSAKLDVLLDRLVEVTAEGHRALVFSTFTGFLGRARERLEAAGLDYAYLDGSTTDRGRVVAQFREGAAPVFLISLKAGGVGLTLTEADYVFVLDPWWNPAAEAQAVDRAHRIGQDRTVMVYRMVSRDTIEEKVMALKARKAALFARVLDGETQMSQSITAADIRTLFED